ncbi:VOC family protein [Marispirochaeta aestuarii]|uniref:VOC family protein n=1 Tax=Marispirochaeta aestuarii TaxID=1963862 RepID=UPI0029C9846E|nr:VOC family protein [Marispirochaeta aestuarii]
MGGLEKEATIQVGKRGLSAMVIVPRLACSIFYFHRKFRQIEPDSGRVKTCKKQDVICNLFIEHKGQEMKTKFSHVNIISNSWKKLADFYISVFDCKPKPPERNLSGDWVDNLTDLSNTEINGVHLILPGYDTEGPTLEIFEYNKNIINAGKNINLEGFGHIAFAVENVEQKLNLLLENGGSAVGKLIDAKIEGVGKISVVYARDPEGNIIEIQKWE